MRAANDARYRTGPAQKPEMTALRFLKALSAVALMSATLLAGADAYPPLAREFEGRVRSELQVRVEVRVVAPGSIARGVYKTPLVQVR